MKIALVHYTGAPVVGGVERIIEEHARLFAAHGHEVAVLCQRGQDARLPEHASTEVLTATLRPILAGQDVVLVHNVMTMPFDPALTEALALMATELAAVRFVAWTHDVAACNPDLAPVAESVRRAHAGFDYVAVSELRRRQLRETLAVEAQVVPNGMAPARVLGLPENVARLADKLSLFDGRLVLSHPTRLLRRKNIEFGMAVIAALRTAGCHTTLLVTGPEDPHHAASRVYAAGLREQRARLGLEQEVVFVGEYFTVGDAELAGLYRLADALFFPSRQEGFGLPILEAALHRLPVFCTDLEPLREIAFPGSAFLFAVDAPAQEVAEMVRTQLAADPPTAARKSALRRFGWPAIYQTHLAPLLERLTQPRG